MNNETKAFAVVFFLIGILGIISGVTSRKVSSLTSRIERLESRPEREYRWVKCKDGMRLFGFLEPYALLTPIQAADIPSTDDCFDRDNHYEAYQAKESYHLDQVYLKDGKFYIREEKTTNELKSISQ